MKIHEYTENDYNEIVDNSFKIDINDDEAQRIDELALDHYRLMMPHKFIADHLYKMHSVDDGRPVYSLEETKKRIKRRDEDNFLNNSSELDLIKIIAKGKGATSLDKMFSGITSLARLFQSGSNSIPRLKGLDGYKLGQEMIATSIDIFESNESNIFPSSPKEFYKIAKNGISAPAWVLFVGHFGYDWFMKPDEKKDNIFLSREAQEILSAGDTNGFDEKEHVGKGVFIEIEQTMNLNGAPSPVCILATIQGDNILMSTMLKNGNELACMSIWNLEEGDDGDILFFHLKESINDIFSDKDGKDKDGSLQRIREFQVYCERLLKSTLALKYRSPEIFYSTADKTKDFFIQKSLNAKSSQKKKQALRMADRVSMFSFTSPDVKKHITRAPFTT